MRVSEQRRAEAEGRAAVLAERVEVERRDADARIRELIEVREQAARAQGERDVLQEALQAAQATAEDAGRRTRIADERAAAAHQRAAEITAVMGRVAEGLEHMRQIQVTATEAVAAAKAEREAAQAKVEEAALRAGEAEARADEVRRRAETAEARLEHLQRLPAETVALDTAELEAAQARAAEAERRAATANERLDRFQRERITRAQEATARASEAAQVASLEAEARQPLWRRIFRRRAGRAP